MLRELFDLDTDGLSRQTKVSGVFVALAIALWLASMPVTDSQYIQAGILLGVGVIAPTVVLAYLDGPREPPR